MNLKILLVFIPIFTSLTVLFFYSFLNSKKQQANRFIPYISLLYIIDALYYFVLSFLFEFSQEITDIKMPPFSIAGMSLVFFFANELISNKKLKNKIVLLHLIPSFIFTILFFVNFLDMTSLKINVNLHNVLRNLSAFAMAFMYFILLFRKRNKIQIKKHQYIKFIHIVLILFQTLWIYFIFWFVVSYKLNNIKIISTQMLVKSLEIIMTVVLYFYVFKVYKFELYLEKQKENTKLLISENIENSENKIIEQNETIHFQVSETNHAKQILEYFNKNKNEYLKPEFNLKKLEEATKIPSNELRIAFSTELNSGFYQFLNQKRIQHACKLLQKTGTITEISKNCGYKSRTSFYKNFELVMGISVSEWRKQNS